MCVSINQGELDRWWLVWCTHKVQVDKMRVELCGTGVLHHPGPRAGRQARREGDTQRYYPAPTHWDKMDRQTDKPLEKQPECCGSISHPCQTPCSWWPLLSLSAGHPQQPHSLSQADCNAWLAGWPGGPLWLRLDLQRDNLGSSVYLLPAPPPSPPSLYPASLPLSLHTYTTAYLSHSTACLLHPPYTQASLSYFSSGFWVVVAGVYVLGCRYIPFHRGSVCVCVCVCVCVYTGA